MFFRLQCAGNFTTTDIYWKGNEVTLQNPEEGEAEFFEQVTGTMFIPTGKCFLAETKGTLSQCKLAGMDACNRAGGDGDIRSYGTMGISG